MSKRTSLKNHAPRESGGLSPAALTVLIAFGAIGGLNGVAAIISAAGTVIEAVSKRCNADDSAVNATKSGGGGR